MLLTRIERCRALPLLQLACRSIDRRGATSYFTPASTLFMVYRLCRMLLSLRLMTS